MSSFKPLALCLVLFSGHVLSFACGNEYTFTELPLSNNKLRLNILLSNKRDTTAYWHNGFRYSQRMRYYGLQQQLIKSGMTIKDGDNVTWEDLQMALDKNIDYKVLSDFAWNMVKVGDKALAVKLLEALYEKHPDEYNILANLGTAYEVTGQNEKALLFLKKAVAINPQSHYGSEWIHINILEQKINPIPDHTKIIGLAAEKDYLHWLTRKSYDKEIKPDSLMKQLAYQLHERISFVGQPDPIVGQLVLDFADLVAITYSPAKARQFYDYAMSYYRPLKARINTRIKSTPSNLYGGRPNR